MRVAVIADDLTGAADAGVQFARAGHATAVAFHGAPLPALGAVVAETGSRGADAPEAARRVREATARLAAAPLLLKKIDSTLRGPVAAEVAAALEASGRERAVVAPAFPAAGRTTDGGVQFLDGAPIGDLRALLAGIDADVADARTDADLDAVVREIRDPASVLWVGTAGLARALADAHPGAGFDPPPEAAATRTLVVVGSTSAVARAQADRLEAAGVPVAVPAPGAAARVRAALDARGVCLLRPAGGEAPDRIVRSLAEVAAQAADGRTTLVLTGGHTAIAVARRLGATGLSVERELEPGVVAGRLIGPVPLRVVTKAGGFGGPDALLRALGGKIPA